MSNSDGMARPRQKETGAACAAPVLRYPWFAAKVVAASCGVVTRLRSVRSTVSSDPRGQLSSEIARERLIQALVLRKET